MPLIIRMKDITTISLERKTKDLLDKAGKRGESYDEIVRRLLNGSRD